MADPSVRAFATSADSTSDPRTVDKPSGLTVGDRMVMFALVAGGSPSANPSGWDVLSSDVATHGAFAWSKVADSSDVAASTFSVANADGKHMSLVLYAVENAGEVEYHAAKAASTNVAITGFDPEASGDLILAAAECSVSDWYIKTANNNPTWTLDWSSSAYWKYAARHGTYEADTATGDVTGYSYTYEHAFAVVAVEPGGGAPPEPEPEPDLFLDGVWG